MRAAGRRLRGFTLIELLVTVALVAVLMALAAPSFSSFQRNSELTSFANNMVATINAARSESIKRGRYAMLVPMDSSNWASGWRAFVDVNRNQVYDSADVVVATRDALPSYLGISASGTALATPPYVMFDASGYATTKGSGFASLVFNVVRNDVAASAVADQTRRIIVSNTGRARVCKPASDSTCTSTATQ